MSCTYLDLGDLAIINCVWQSLRLTGSLRLSHWLSITLLNQWLSNWTPLEAFFVLLENVFNTNKSRHNFLWNIKISTYLVILALDPWLHFSPWLVLTIDSQTPTQPLAPWVSGNWQCNSIQLKEHKVLLWLLKQTTKVLSNILLCVFTYCMGVAIDFRQVSIFMSVQIVTCTYRRLMTIHVSRVSFPPLHQ